MKKLLIALSLILSSQMATAAYYDVTLTRTGDNTYLVENWSAGHVSADRNRHHKGAYDNHQLGSSRHISKHSRHYYNRHNNHGRRYVSYDRPYRYSYYPRYYSDYNVVIVRPGLFIGF